MRKRVVLTFETNNPLDERILEILDKKERSKTDYIRYLIIKEEGFVNSSNKKDNEQTNNTSIKTEKEKIINKEESKIMPSTNPIDLDQDLLADGMSLFNNI